MSDKPLETIRKTQTENVVCVYENRELVAVLKRDDLSKKKIIYSVKEASIDQIAELINQDHTPSC